MTSQEQTKTDKERLYNNLCIFVSCYIFYLQRISVIKKNKDYECVCAPGYNILYSLMIKLWHKTYFTRTIHYVIDTQNIYAFQC